MIKNVYMKKKKLQKFFKWFSLNALEAGVVNSEQF